MHLLASILDKTVPGKELILTFNSYSMINPSFSQANASLMFSTQYSRTSIVAQNRSHLRYGFSSAASPVNSYRLGAYSPVKSSPEMAPVCQDIGLVIVVMGVSGAGKSTIGHLLAEALGCTFLDADDFHPESNKEKMSKGIPLSDEDRMPWLQVLCQALKERITSGKCAVLACSALRKTYREILRTSDPSYVPGEDCRSVNFVLLDVPVEILSARLNERLAKGEHFMPPALLHSQLELLEIDASEGILQIDATQSPSVIVDSVQNLLLERRINVE